MNRNSIAKINIGLWMCELIALPASSLLPKARLSPRLRSILDVTGMFCDESVGDARLEMAIFNPSPNSLRGETPHYSYYCRSTNRVLGNHLRVECEIWDYRSEVVATTQSISPNCQLSINYPSPQFRSPGISRLLLAKGR